MEFDLQIGIRREEYKIDEVLERDKGANNEAGFFLWILFYKRLSTK